MTTKFIFITGGVTSSLGKGIATSSLGALLQSHGYSVRLRKLDPYLNIDPGTMSPYQHGEVFVTSDGMESDLDLGNYERFTGLRMFSSDYVTTGKIYSSVLSKERKGDYLGATVQVIPHITDEIKNFITSHTDSIDFVLCEIGGTVGDIESLPYLEAIRQLRHDFGVERTMFIHLTLLPFIKGANELKTKPTQHSVKELLSVGIQPDVLLCRSDRPITEDIRKKLSLFCNVKVDHVINGLDVDNIYKIPLMLHRDGFDERILSHFKMTGHSTANLNHWSDLAYKIDHPKGHVRIGIVGKYVQLPDAYKSVIQALHHACFANQIHLNLVLIDSNEHLHSTLLETLDGILVPGGFGERGTQGKLKAIEYARTHNIPFLGICFGMQLTMVEFARNVLGLRNASSTEFGSTSEPIIDLMTKWIQDEQVNHRGKNSDKGGTMRLGSYPCHLKKNSLAQKVYGCETIQERHRHRYEVNISYKDQFESKGLIFSGLSPDGYLPEIVELKEHPFFMACQFHPEFESTPFKPHSLFVEFVKSSVAHSVNI
jgi:CTP synthase